MYRRPENLFVLKHLLQTAKKGKYAIGAFNTRVIPVSRTVLRTAQRMQSPIIIQVGEIELKWFELTISEFARGFFEIMEEDNITIPVGLHLDHTQELNLIREAISCGFTSVMIDASSEPLEENIQITRKVVEYAHARGVSVEAELGHIGWGDSIESQSDKEKYTDPEEAELFVNQTDVDALAVSVGTAHGVYTVQQPKVDIEILTAIRAKTSIPLVLHGGSGTPDEMIIRGIQIPGGGVSKINVATDVELGMLKALGLKDRLSNEAVMALSKDDQKRGMAGVEAVVEKKITNFLGSQGHAVDFDQNLLNILKK